MLIQARDPEEIRAPDPMKKSAPDPVLMHAQRRQRAAVPTNVTAPRRHRVPRGRLAPVRSGSRPGGCACPQAEAANTRLPRRQAHHRHSRAWSSRSSLGLRQVQWAHLGQGSRCPTVQIRRMRLMCQRPDLLWRRLFPDCADSCVRAYTTSVRDYEATDSLRRYCSV